MTDDEMIDMRVTVWFEDDTGFYSDNAGGGELAGSSEELAVKLFRSWWRGKQRERARAKGRACVYDPSPSNARH